MDLATLFYRDTVGVYPFSTDREEAITRCTIAHTVESGMSRAEIEDLFPLFKKKAYIEPADLPDYLWEDSLIERNEFYTHKEIQILSPPPKIRTDGTFQYFPFYQEMKIRYTIKDLSDYFYFNAASQWAIIDERRDEGQLRHLLNKYRGLQSIQPLDIVLSMIDEVKFRNSLVSQPFDISSADIEETVLQKLQESFNERKSKGYDRIIWRTYLTDKGAITWKT